MHALHLAYDSCPRVLWDLLYPKHIFFEESELIIQESQRALPLQPEPPLTQQLSLTMSTHLPVSTILTPFSPHSPLRTMPASKSLSITSERFGPGPANEKYGYTNMRTSNQPITCLLSLSQSLSRPLQWILHGLIGTINSSPLCLTSFLLGSSNVPTTSHTSLQICSSSFARNTSFKSRLSEMLHKQRGTSSRRLGTILLLPSRLLDPVFSSHLPPK